MLDKGLCSGSQSTVNQRNRNDEPGSCNCRIGSRDKRPYRSGECGVRPSEPGDLLTSLTMATNTSFTFVRCPHPQLSETKHPHGNMAEGTASSPAASRPTLSYITSPPSAALLFRPPSPFIPRDRPQFLSAPSRSLPPPAYPNLPHLETTPPPIPTRCWLLGLVPLPFPALTAAAASPLLPAYGIIPSLRMLPGEPRFGIRSTRP